MTYMEVEYGTFEKNSLHLFANNNQICIIASIGSEKAKSETLEPPNLLFT